MDSLTGVFRTPVLVQLVTPWRCSRFTQHSQQGHCLYASGPGQTSVVLFDKGNWLLKELHFQKPREEWMYQAEKAASPVDRLNAIKALSALSDSDDVIPLLSRIALHDRVLGCPEPCGVHDGRQLTQNDSMKQIIKTTLLTACQDSNSHVRDAAVSGLSTRRGDDVVARSTRR